MDSINIFAPATVANVACGFDIFGLAVDNPGDEVIVRKRTDDRIVIEKITGDEGKLTLDPTKNTVSVPIIKYLSQIESKHGFDIILNKKMPLGSGLHRAEPGQSWRPLVPLATRTSLALPFCVESVWRPCGVGWG